MDDRILFATHCHWMKFDLDPQVTKDWGAPLNGTLFVTSTTLEFSGRYKAYTGNMLASATSGALARLIGEFRFAVPLRLIRNIQATQTSASFLFIKKEAVRLEVLYHREVPGDEKRVYCFPHFGLEPPTGPQTFLIAPEIASLYQPNLAQAFIWERVLRHLVASQNPVHV